VSENYTIQVSFKTPTQTLINLRATDESELSEQLDILGRQLKGVGEIEALLAGMSNIYAGMSPVEKIKADAEAAAAAPASRQGNGGAPQPVQAAGGAPAGADGQMCRHGSMVWKTGTGKNGREWKAWMCPSTNRADQCDPQWVR
jgi:hypothetical protein